MFPERAQVMSKRPWDPLGGRERFQDRVRRQNPGHFKARMAPKSSLGGFKIEPDRFPNAILKQKEFQNRFYINFGATSKPKPKPKSFKTLMMSFKNGLCVYTPSNVIDDALITDFGSEKSPKIDPKSLP